MVEKHGTYRAWDSKCWLQAIKHYRESFYGQGTYIRSMRLWNLFCSARDIKNVKNFKTYSFSTEMKSKEKSLEVKNFLQHTKKVVWVKIEQWNEIKFESKVIWKAFETWCDDILRFRGWSDGEIYLCMKNLSSLKKF